MHVHVAASVYPYHTYVPWQGFCFILFLDMQYGAKNLQCHVEQKGGTDKELVVTGFQETNAQTEIYNFAQDGCLEDSLGVGQSYLEW